MSVAVSACWTPPRLAKRWGCRITLVLRLIQEGRLRAFNLGMRTRPRWRIPTEAVEEFERSRGAVAPVQRKRKRDDTAVISFF